MATTTATSSAISGVPMMSSTLLGPPLGQEDVGQRLGRHQHHRQQDGRERHRERRPGALRGGHAAAVAGGFLLGFEQVRRLHVTQRAASRANNGPAMITVGMATSTTSPSVMPRLALRALTATACPGGAARVRAWPTDPPGPGCRPHQRQFGTPGHEESASSLPNIAPRAISDPTLAAVEPNPLLKLVIAASSAIPATRGDYQRADREREERVHGRPGDQDDDDGDAEERRDDELGATRRGAAAWASRSPVTTTPPAP